MITYIWFLLVAAMLVITLVSHEVVGELELEGRAETRRQLRLVSAPLLLFFAVEAVLRFIELAR